MDFLQLKITIQRGDRLMSIHAVSEALADILDPDMIWSSILLQTSEIVEDYPTDPRGPSCLLLSFIDGQPIHTVVAFPAKRIATQKGITVLAFMITVYCPDQRSHEWSADYRTRLPQP